MRGYSITNIGGQHWLVSCSVCNDNTATVRVGIESAFEWIRYHEDHQDDLHKGK